MTEREFTIGGREFQLGKIDAFKQFHIVRRVGPLLADLLPAMKNFSSKQKEMADLSESEKFDFIADLAAPLMAGLSKLSDQDADLVMRGLLSSVQMKQDKGNWAYIANQNMVMIQDLELPTLLNIAGRAFVYNLAGFFTAPPRQ